MTDSHDGVFTTLEELQRCPELLIPPECVVPRLAYRGRLVVLAGPDKSGKSTLAGHAISSLSYGRPFLGERVTERHGRSVLVGLEEAVGDVVRRLSGVQVTVPSRVQILNSPADAALLGQLLDLLTNWPADLVVIDSLTEYARTLLGSVPDDGDNSGWASIMRPLVALARDRDVAVLVLHHVRKADGTYRGPTEIAAAVDALLEMELGKPGEDPTLRRYTGRGRWSIEPFTTVEGECGPELGGGSRLSLEARVLFQIEQSPGLSGTAICKRVGGRRATVLDSIRALEARGAIQNDGSEGRPCWRAGQGQRRLAAIG